MVDPGQVQAVGNALEAADKALGRFPQLTLALDEGLAAILRLGGVDWLRAQQTVNAAALRVKVDQKLSAIADARRTEASASVILSLLADALDEHRDELQDLWAALLANTMVDGGSRVRREYFAILRAMEPEDAHVLRLWGVEGSNGQTARDSVQHKASSMGIDIETYAVATRTLIRLGCLRPTEPSDGAPVAGLAPLGRGFLRACRVT
jgi:Abortive infection alpha